MLNATENAMSKEQFVKLREARKLIRDQFDCEFLLQSDSVIRDLYQFALRSKTNELFRIFSQLNAISDAALPNPLNEEQFILLREAKDLISDEFDVELPLAEPTVMDTLYDFALRAASEALFDIYAYLISRPDRPDALVSEVVGPRILRLRDLVQAISGRSNDALSCAPDAVEATIRDYVENSDDTSLAPMLAALESPEPDHSTKIVFQQLSAPDFERLRQAQEQILAEFDTGFSLHADSAMDDLYGFAVRSKDVDLFNLFGDLVDPQMQSRESARKAQDWLSKDQFTLLRSAADAVQQEFDTTLDLRSSSVQEDLYQFALRAEEESLFDLCWEFQQLADTQGGPQLPTKDEFRALRRARRLITEEFATDLSAKPEDLAVELYRFAVNSEHNELFDLFTELMALPQRVTPAPPEGFAMLSREEFVALREARHLIQEEFGETLALEQNDVLDRLYVFALESEDEALFDLHAELNTRAVEPAAPTSPTPKTAPTRPAAPAPKAESQKAEPPKATAPPPQPNKKGGLSSLWNNLRGKPTGSETAQQSVKSIVHAPPSPKKQAGSAQLATATPVAAETTATNAAPPLLTDSKPEATGNAEQAAEEPRTEDGTETSETTTSNEPDDANQVDGNKEFGDRLVRAMAKERAKSKSRQPARKRRTAAKAQARDNPAQTKPENSGQRAKLQTKPLRVVSNPDSIWYINTPDETMRIRLSDRLVIGMKGELLPITTDNEDAGAMLDLIEDKPVIQVGVAQVFVNDAFVEDTQELATGDRISVAGATLCVEAVKNNQTAAN